jgi:hypothetical protein
VCRSHPTVETRELWNIARALVLGDAQQAWPGALDQLVLATVSASDELPTAVLRAFHLRRADAERSYVSSPVARSIRPRTPGPVRIRLRFDDGTEDEVRINGFGTIE